MSLIAGRVSHYEIHFVDSSGQIQNTERYGADDKDSALARIRDYRSQRLQPMGFTIFQDRFGAESEMSGLH